MKTLRFFIGTHASAGQDSLCLCEADFEAGSFSTLHSMREISDPTYLALSADRILYTFGKTAVGVSVYAIRDQVVLNSLPCASGGPCHNTQENRQICNRPLSLPVCLPASFAHKQSLSCKFHSFPNPSGSCLHTKHSQGLIHFVHSHSFLPLFQFPDKSKSQPCAKREFLLRKSCPFSLLLNIITNRTHIQILPIRYNNSLCAL